MMERRRPPPKRGPSVLPDSLIARASFTHGFPHYPNPNLPMALQPVLNRCANSTVRIDRLFPLDKGFGGLDSFTKQSGPVTVLALMDAAGGRIRRSRGPSGVGRGWPRDLHVPERSAAHPQARGPYGDADGSASDEMTIESMMTASSGRPMRGSLTGTVAISSITSVPEITLPKMVYTPAARSC